MTDIPYIPDMQFRSAHTREQTFETLVLRPHWKQYLVNLGHLLAAMFACAMLACWLQQWKWPSVVMLAIAIMLSVKIIMQYVMLARIKYILTDEQLIYCHGVLMHETDYQELFRVIDYQQNRTLLQQLAGLKNVTVLSGDRNTPRLVLTGIQEQMDIITIIRQRVLFNREKRGIYEIGNYQ